MPSRDRRTVYENALRCIYKDKMVDLPDLPKWWLDKVIFWEGQKFQKWPFWDVQELITLWPKLNYNWVIKDAPVYLHMFFRYHHANSSWRVTVKSSFVKIHEGFLFLQFYIDYGLFHNVTVLLHWLMKAYSDRYTNLKEYFVFQIGYPVTKPWKQDILSIKCKLNLFREKCGYFYFSGIKQAHWWHVYSDDIIIHRRCLQPVNLKTLWHF